VRYINRWHLEKQDADTFSPKKIVFWNGAEIPLMEGVLMWNLAFEQV